MKLNVNEGIVKIIIEPLINPKKSLENHNISLIMVNITLIQYISNSTITYTQMFEEYIILRGFMYLFSM